MNKTNDYFVIQVRFHKTHQADIIQWLKEKAAAEDAKMATLARRMIRDRVRQEKAGRDE